MCGTIDQNRVALYVSGAQSGYIERAATFCVENVVLCLEDGTPETKKTEARYLVANAIKEFRNLKKKFIVRINSVASGLWEEDLNVVLPSLPQCIRIPKVDGPEDVRMIDEHLMNILSNCGVEEHPTYEVMVESHLGFENLSKTLASNKWISLVTVGGEDLHEDLKRIGVGSDVDLVEIKRNIVRIASNAGLRSFDTTYMDYRNSKGFIENSINSKALGFYGRSVIHPNQIIPAMNVYSSN